jgi:hypothetical protein
LRPPSPCAHDAFRAPRRHRGDPRGPRRRRQRARGRRLCVDTITAGPSFLGAGAGLRYRDGQHLDAILAFEAQLGTPDRTFNLDFNLGLAFVL